MTASPSITWTRKLEEGLARAIGVRCAEIERRLDAIEERQQFEARLARLEFGAGGTEAEARFERGMPLAASEWEQLCARLRAPLRVGQWEPRFNSWRGGR